MRIAVILNGGVNAGYQNQGMPVLMSLFIGLSEKHELVVYSLSHVDDLEAPFKIVNVKEGKLRKLVSLMQLVKRHHNEKPFDIIHGFFGLPSGLMAAILGKLLKVPSVATLMGGESANVPEAGFGALRKNRGKLQVFWMIRNATKVIAQTAYQVRTLQANGLKHINNIVVIPFGVLKSKERSQRAYKEPYQLVSVGNINAVKNHETMLEMLDVLRKEVSVELTIVGGDFYGGKIQKLVESKGLGDIVRFVGEKNNQEALSYLAGSDLLVICSRSEGMSVVFVEAMNLGVPTCATPVGLMSDLAESHCLIAQIGDYIKLASQVKKILTSESLRREIIKNGLEWTALNDVSATVIRHETLYEQVK